MKNGYEAPEEIGTIEKMLSDFVYHNGYEMSQVFNNWLEYIIGFFSIEGKPIESWRYNQEQNKFFYELMAEWIQIMYKQIVCRGWYDAFVTLYEYLIASKSRRDVRGQFFTPSISCDFMDKIHGTEEELTGRGYKVNDPTCWSGRTLIVFHVHAPGNYMYGEDIDRTCCMMTVHNY